MRKWMVAALVIVGVMVVAFCTYRALKEYGEKRVAVAVPTLSPTTGNKPVEVKVSPSTRVEDPAIKTLEAKNPGLMVAELSQTNKVFKGTVNWFSAESRMISISSGNETEDFQVNARAVAPKPWLQDPRNPNIPFDFADLSVGQYIVIATAAYPPPNGNQQVFVVWLRPQDYLRLYPE